MRVKRGHVASLVFFSASLYGPKGLNDINNQVKS